MADVRRQRHTYSTRGHTDPTEIRHRAVLNPFEVGSRSFDILQKDLGALGRARLVDIIHAFDLNPGNEDIDWMSDAQLRHFIWVAVRAQSLYRR